MPSLNQKICSVEGCEKKSRKLGYCSAHYNRFRRTGSVGTAPIRKPRPKICSVDNCASKHFGMGYCVTHYNKHYRQTHPLYITWQSMRQRCSDPSTNSYEHYGGRGIKVCDRWLHSYKNFIADMGEKPTPDHSIDRIDVDGNYEPSNCRWATNAEQRMNKRKI